MPKWPRSVNGSLVCLGVVIGANANVGLPPYFARLSTMLPPVF
jgi:hypothetical protein